MIEISLIVPVYNAQNFLSKLITSIKNQTLSNDLYEVIFVDNGSTDSSVNIIERFITDYPNINLVKYADKPSSYAARNFGVRYARGKILAFTDSDCILTPGWLKTIQKFSEKGVVLSGKIELNILDKKNIWEIFDSKAHLDNQATHLLNKIATANMAVTQEDFISVGNFLEVFSGGDFEWSSRANQKGLNIIYLDNMKVYHPTRKTYKEIIKKSERIAFGDGEKTADKGKVQFLVALYFTKIFYLKTNYKYSKILWRYGIGIPEIIKFNFLFIRIRILQLLSAKAGFEKKDARLLKLK